MKTKNEDVKYQTKFRILSYIMNHENSSRQELSASLGYSMPTVLQNVTELLEENRLCEVGEFNSTGGRRAKMLAIKPLSYCSVGAEITKNKIRCAMVDFNGDLLGYEQYPMHYFNNRDYYTNLGTLLYSFIDKCRESKTLSDCKLTGIGIATPGAVNLDLNILLRSHALHVSNLDLRNFSSNITDPVYFERADTAAARSEINSATKDLVYLYLGYTVGGAIYTNGSFFRGDYYKAGGFGHSIISLGGRQCECGKRGCAAAYCSIDALLSSSQSDSLISFFEQLKRQDEKTVENWNVFLEMLAVILANIRMEFDCNIVIGGDISGYLVDYLDELKAKTLAYNNFDLDTSYISIGKYHNEAAAIGAAKRVIEKHLQDCCPSTP